ncbi:hypothetical protein [Paenibacillus jiagnxiensis]|uniref:hypothetical protein n=1 Tax=Paenibacillus jiagnxiensis TaxID=3228926 RepID=UPI0033A842E8
MTDHQQLENLIAKYVQLGQRIIAHVKELDENQLIEFVEQRDEIVKQMEPFQSAITDDLRRRIQEMLHNEKVIVERMQEIKQEAAEWLERRGNIRSQQSAYQRSYTIGGSFIDYRN